MAMGGILIIILIVAGVLVYEMATEGYSLGKEAGYEEGVKDVLEMLPKESLEILLGEEGEATV